jgi:hypothetical protein
VADDAGALAWRFGPPGKPVVRRVDILTIRDARVSAVRTLIAPGPPALPARRHGLPAELDAVVGRALAKSPSDRYDSCRDFTEAFQRALGPGRYGASVAAGASHHRAEGRTLDLGRGGPTGVHLEPAATAPLVLQRPTRQPGQPELGRSRLRRRRGRCAIAAAAAVVVVAGAVAFFTLAHPRHASGIPAAGTGHTAGRALSALGWHTYRDSSGFSISLPHGWNVASTRSDEVEFTGTPAGFVVVVAWSTDPQTDALADWQQASE